MTDDALRTRSLAGPALLAGAVLLVVHAAVSELLARMVVTVAGPPTGIALGGLWLLTLVAAACAVRPILRRVERPVPAGLVAGVVAAAGYALITVAFGEPATATTLLEARLASFVIVAAIVGAIRSPTDDEAPQGGGD